MLREHKGLSGDVGGVMGIGGLAWSVGTEGPVGYRCHQGVPRGVGVSGEHHGAARG